MSLGLPQHATKVIQLAKAAKVILATRTPICSASS